MPVQSRMITRIWRAISHADTARGLAELFFGWGLGGIATGGFAAMLTEQPIFLWGLYGLGVAWAMLGFVLAQRYGWIKSVTFPVVVTLAIALLYWNQLQIQKDLECYVLPRTLSKQQADTLTKFLLQHDPQDYTFRLTRSDEEASSFRADLQRALRAANWHLIGIEYKDDIQAGGVNIRYQQSNEMQQRRNNRRPDDPIFPDELLRDALNAADIPVSGGGGGTGQDITDYSLWIEIGQRRRDKGWCNFVTEGEV